MTAMLTLFHTFASGDWVTLALVLVLLTGACWYGLWRLGHAIADRSRRQGYIQGRQECAMKVIRQVDREASRRTLTYDCH